MEKEMVSETLCKQFASLLNLNRLFMLSSHQVDTVCPTLN